MPRRTAAVSVVLAALLLPLTGCGRLSARMKLKAGNRAYKESRWGNALEAYAQVPEGVPERIHAALGTAYTHMAQYRFGSKMEKDRKHAQDAIEAYDTYLKLLKPGQADKDLPDREKVEEWIITLLVDTERYPEAVDRLNKQLQAKPNDPAILRALASTYEKQNKPGAAVQFYQQWARTFPTDPAPQVAIAAFCWNISFRQAAGIPALIRNRWIDNGLEAADAALKIKPDHYEGMSYKNLLLRERSKMRVDPDLVADLQSQANVLLAQVNEMRKKQKEAEEAAKAKAPAAGASPGAAPAGSPGAAKSGAQ